MNENSCINASSPLVSCELKPVQAYLMNLLSELNSLTLNFPVAVIDDHGFVWQSWFNGDHSSLLPFGVPYETL